MSLSYAVLVLLGLLSVSLALPFSGRVVGGQNAAKGEFPWQVSLLKNNNHNCGGSIISKNHILTAAHCVVQGNGIQPYPTYMFKVRVGSINRLAGGKIMDITKVTVHPKYGNFLNDVAVLTLSQPIVESETVKIIKLASAEVPVGKEVTISGWGRLTTEGVLPAYLQHNNLVAITTDECDKTIGMGYDSLICLAHQPDNGACNGDSGGPATYNKELVGVAGFVYGGCGSSFPDGYAKVFYHKEWISEQIQ